MFILKLLVFGVGTLSLCCANPATRAVKANSVPLRILATGDSITFGSQSTDKGGYRTILDRLLRLQILDGQTPPEWIGTQQNGPNQPTLFHEGYSGIRAGELQKRLFSNAKSILDWKPNVVLLMVGTNNFYQGIELEKTKGEIDALVGEIVSRTDGDAFLFIGGLIPIGAVQNPALPPNEKQRQVNLYNDYLKKLVVEGKAKGWKIEYVPSSVDQNSRADILHPNDKGYETMAKDWLGALKIVIDKNLIPPKSAVVGFVCPVLPTWVDRGQVSPPGANLGRDLQPPVVCVDQSDNLKLCRCVFSGDPSSTSWTVTKIGASCTEMSYNNIHAVQYADIDGDGRADYLHVNANGGVRAFRNTLVDGKTTWVDAGMITTGVGGKRHQVAFADLNGDGRAEYLWIHPDGRVDAWLNTGASPTANPASVAWKSEGLIVPFAAGSDHAGSRVIFADIDGDGRAEYIWIRDDGNLQIYHNAGVLPGSDPKGAKIRWERQKITAIGGGGTRHQTRLVDTNGDGRADFLVMRGDGSVDLWLNGLSVGAPSERDWISKGRVADGVGNPKKPASQIMFADIDGNGKSDYIYVNPEKSVAYVWANYCIS